LYTILLGQSIKTVLSSLVFVLSYNMYYLLCLNLTNLILLYYIITDNISIILISLNSKSNIKSKSPRKIAAFRVILRTDLE